MKDKITSGVTELEKTVNGGADEAMIATARKVCLLEIS